jgi:RNA polymerase sigma factor (sigma-70 family)
LKALTPLIRRAQAGNLDAFDALVRRFQDMAVGYAYTLIGDFHLAEDAAQEAFLDAYRNLSQLREAVAFSSWFRTIVFKHCDRFRRQARAETVPLEMVAEMASDGLRPDEALEAGERREQVLAVIRALPEAERQVITLFYISEYSQNEIAAFLSAPVTTVKNRLRAGRTRLKERMIDMAKKALHEEAPSRDDAFANAIASKIRQKLRKFVEDTKSTPLSPDEALLVEACQDVERALNQEVTPELVHLAHDIYGYLGHEGLEKRVSLHRRYMSAAQDMEERFWSNWHMVDSLAVLRRSREAVEEQSRLYQWASQSLTDEHVLKALYDSTQALCWIKEGRIDEWYRLYYENLERVSRPGVSRYTRCCYVRTGAEVAPSVGRLTEALTETERLERINNEEPDWEYHVPFWCGVMTTKLGIYRQQEAWSRFDEVATEAVSFVEKKVQQLKSGESVNIRDLSWVAHDVGVSLMWAKRYEQAKYLLKVALEFRDMGGTHFFLATCIWASEKDRQKTLYHLRMAQNKTADNPNRGYQHQFFLETPEFSDVKDDKEFLEALGRGSKT